METALLWILGIAVAALALRIQRMLAGLSPHFVCLQFAHTRESFKGILDAWGADGVARYRAHFRWDFALIACYAAFGYLLASGPWLSAGLSPLTASVLAALLPFAALYDAAENIIHQCITRGTRDHPGAIFPIAAGIALVKWLLFVAFILAVAGRLFGLLPGS